MSDQWIHDFIDTRILLDRFNIEEFVDFTVVVNDCDVPIFKNMQSPWNLSFEFDENNHFKWKAIEYENEDDPHGICILEGNMKISKSKFPKQWCPEALDVDEDVINFIKSMFPESYIDQTTQPNNFIIDGEVINFNNMEHNSEYIYLEFTQTS